jgi:hypothetical protein
MVQVAQSLEVWLDLLLYYLPSASVLRPRITGGKNTKSSARHKLSARRDHEQVVRQKGKLEASSPRSPTGVPIDDHLSEVIETPAYYSKPQHQHGSIDREVVELVSTDDTQESVSLMGGLPLCAFTLAIAPWLVHVGTAKRGEGKPTTTTTSYSITEHYNLQLSAMNSLRMIF